MSAYRTPARRAVSAFVFASLTLGLAACGTEQVHELGGQDVKAAQSQVPAEFAFNGAPSYMLPPFAQTSGPEAAARMPDGYSYSYGQLTEQTSYGVYSYFADQYQYVSTSIWSNDGSSVSQSLNLSGDGSQWIQSGSYSNEGEGEYLGSYTTTYIDTQGVATQYLTDFHNTSTRSEYSSTMDRANTPMLPDGDSMSIWTPEESYYVASQYREDGSRVRCESTYSNSQDVGAGGAIVYNYVSDNTCNDSRTSQDPDFHQVWSSSWNSSTGEYTSSAAVQCLDKTSNLLSMTYDMNAGWLDSNGNAVSGPYELCAVTGVWY